MLRLASPFRVITGLVVSGSGVIGSEGLGFGVTGGVTGALELEPPPPQACKVREVNRIARDKNFVGYSTIYPLNNSATLNVDFLVGAECHSKNT
jgi:hypothetical protein